MVPERDRIMDPLGMTMAWLATQGLMGLVGVTLFERMVPIVPAHALLVAIGVACAQGRWPLPQAIAVTALASFAGCLCIHAAGSLVGPRRSLAGLHRVSAFLRIPAARWERMVAQCRIREGAFVFAFSAQFVPLAREIAPGLAGMFRAELLPFFTGTAAGIVLWNALFICAGHVAARWSGASNTSGVAFGTLIVLLVAEVVVLAVWRRVVRTHDAGGRE